MVEIETSSIEVPAVVAEVGRDNYVDGEFNPGTYYSEVLVENYTPYEKEEVMTRTITLVQGAFPVTLPGDGNTPQISVSASDVIDGYVQWEPMGDLYPPSVGAPLGSYKYLRVHWDVYIGAGVTGASTVHQYYKAKTYVFQAIEPQTVPSMRLTPIVLSALGAFGNTPVSFEFSGHGYVNRFNFVGGLYGQDRQTDYPDGSAITPPFREPIYTRYFNTVGSVNDSPLITGQQCLKKEYTIHGRILPDLDVSAATYDPITGGTSGPDAPTFWYNLNYELQDNKNIIPFVFQWGVGLMTYDYGTWNPSGAVVDSKNASASHESSNNGPRVMSQEWVDAVRSNGADYQPCIVFSSVPDVTFSILRAEVGSPTSGVEVCACYVSTGRTTFNWFDKANRSEFDILNYGLNCLPHYCCFTLRGVINLNSSYAPAVSLTTRQSNSQNSAKLEELQAIDQNFSSRSLYTIFENAYPEPPDNLLTDKGYSSAFEAGTDILHNFWDGEPYEVCCVRLPSELVTENVLGNPYYNEASQEVANKKLLKDLHDPWAINPMGLSFDAGVQGGQPGFNLIGMGGLNARTGCPDMRFYQKAIDLEWNRVFVESERDGRLLNFDADYWKVSKYVTNPGRIDNEHLQRYINNNGYPTDTSWLSKSIDSYEFSGSKAFILDSNILSFYGMGCNYGGTDSFNFYRGRLSPYYTIPNDHKSGGVAVGYPYGDIQGSGQNKRHVAKNVIIGQPLSKYQTAIGYPGYAGQWAAKKQTYVNSHTAINHQVGYALLSGDKIALRLVDYYLNILANSIFDGEPARKLFYASNNLGPDGYSYPNVGRQEGRPYSGLLCCLGVTRNNTLREKTIYKLSRRFWNFYFATHFEDHPFGHQTKPWRTIRYPGWSDGVSATISNAVPTYTSIGNTKSLFTDLHNWMSLGGDPFTWKYLPSKLRITDVAPNFDPTKAISWDAFSVTQLQNNIWVPPELKFSTATRTNENTPYKIGCEDSPLGPIGVENSLSKKKTKEFSTESYQNGLRFPYLGPVLKLFRNYAAIFASRSGVTPFVTRFGTYEYLTAELEDTTEELKNFFVRAAKSSINNLLFKISSTSVFAGGKSACAYFQSMCSPTRFLEDYTSSERTIAFNSSRELLIPQICTVSATNNNGIVIDYKQYISEVARLGPTFKAINNLNNLGDASYGTNMWTFIQIVWAWEILNDYGNGQYDSYMEEAREYIEDFIGTVPYDLTLAQNTTMRNSVYPKWWGNIGFPSPGVDPNMSDISLGSNEALTWWIGVTDDLWKNRSLDVAYLVGDFLGESDNEVEFSSLSNYESLSGEFEGGIDLSSTITVISAIEMYFRDEGMDGMSLPLYAEVSSGNSEVIVYLLGEYVGESDGSMGKVVVTTSTESDMTFESDFETNLVIPVNIGMTYEGELELDSNKFNKSDNISIGEFEFESDFNISAIQIFLSLPLSEYLGETESDLSSYSVVFNLGTSFLGEFDTSSRINTVFNISSLTYEGESLPLSEFTDLNPDFEYLSDFFPEGTITIYPVGGGTSNFPGPKILESVIASSTSQLTSFISTQRDVLPLNQKQRLSFENQLFREISLRTNEASNVSDIFRQTLEYLINCFSNLYYINDEFKTNTIPCWHGNAERVIAKLKKEANTILPVISVYKQKNEIDPDRRRSASLLHQEKWWDTEKQRAIRVVSLTPIPIKITYKVSVWSKYQEDMDQISEQVHRMFNPDLEIYTEFNSSTKAFLVEEEDSSELNIGDGADRVLKRIFTVSVESYIPTPKFMITNTGKIESINTEIYIPLT